MFPHWPATGVALLFVVCCCVHGGESQAAPDPILAQASALLDKMDAAIAKSGGLECLVTTVHKGDMQTKGLLQARPAENKFKVSLDSNDSSTGVMNFVGDGTIIWMSCKIPGSVMVQKWSPQSLADMSGIARPDVYNMADEIRRHYKVLNIRQDKLNGEPVQILDSRRESRGGLSELFLDGNAAQANEQTRFYISEKDHVLRKLEVLDAGKNLQLSTALSNIQLGKKFADELFVFTPPAGATVMDMRSQESIEGALKKVLEDDAKAAQPRSK